MTHRPETQIDVNLVTEPIEAKGKGIGMTLNSEQQLELMTAGLQASAAAVVITDLRGVILWANDAFSGLTHYTVEEALGKTPGELLRSGFHGKKFYQDFWDTILSGRVWKGEMLNRRKDGSLYFEEMTVTPFRASKSAVTHFIAIKQDITHRKKAEEEYQRRTAELEALEKVSAALRAAQRKADIGPFVVEQLMQVMDVHSASLVLVDLISGDNIIQYAVGDWASVSGRRIPAGKGISAAVIASGKTCVIDDVTSDDRLAIKGILKAPYAAAGAPLLSRNAVIGALWVGRCNEISSGERSFRDDEVRLLAAIADVTANTLHRIMLHEEAERRTLQLAALHTIDEAINSSMDAKLALRVVVDQVTEQLGVDAASILVLDKDAMHLRQVAARGLHRYPSSRALIPVYSSYAGKAILERQMIFIRDLQEAARNGGEPWLGDPALEEEGFVSLLAAPLIAKGQVNGVLNLFHRSQLNPAVEWFEFLDAIAHQAAVAMDNIALLESLQRKNDQLAQAYDILLESWVRSLQLRDHETETHTRRVTEMTLRLARAVGMNDEELVHVRRGALLHDIGKLGVPDSILHKPGPLTEEEWEIMRKHPTYAYELLSPAPYLRQAMDIPLHHHEKWDGSGYPVGLKGTQIPLAARLFTIVDVWDAMCSARPYQPAIPEKEVLAFIQSRAGEQFDPQLVPIFFEERHKADFD
jgi:PAS domain S-box-containing protein